jgi:hypothetical protein
VRKVRSGGQKDLSLSQSFLDQLPLFVIEFKDGLLQVSDTSMNELGRFRRSSCCKSRQRERDELRLYEEQKRDISIDLT